MKIVSFVPSWTETLLWAGVDVVGRTRFCIHPQDDIARIPAIGGTKDADWRKIKELNPDLILFDREENTQEMARQCPVPWHSTHVTSVDDMPRELQHLAQKLNAPRLNELAQRWEKILRQRPSTPKNIPGFLEWERHDLQDYKHIVYVIWAGPWMAAGPDTFLGSMCGWLGWTLWKGPVKYPEFDPQSLSQSLFLCSSEPFPFLKKRHWLKELPGDVALVDGEKLSWFGLRSLCYLESLVGNAKT